MPGKPAARITDLTTHGTPLSPGPGSPNVLIGFLPAWRTIVDFHACPLDGGGVVMLGSPTVWTNFQMQCRIMDQVVEAGGPNPIAMGCPTVLIGEAGTVAPVAPAPAPAGGAAAPAPAPKPPAPPAAVEAKYNDGIVMKGPQDFVDKTKAQLDQIAKTKTGKALLDSLANSKKTTTIVPSTDGSNSAPPKNWKGALGKGKVLKWTGDDGKEHSITGDGSGSGSTVEFNPDKRELAPADEDWKTRPPAVGLAHELVHADDAAHGRMDPEEKDGVPNYERQAVGLPPYEDKEGTENKIRDEWDPKQPKRTHY